MALISSYQLPLFPEKICKKCGVPKPLEQFYLNKNSRDGHRSSCRTCDLAHAHDYRVAHHAEFLTKEQAYRDAHHDEMRARNRPHDTEYTMRYRAKHPEKYKQRIKDVYERHKDVVRAWVKAHPERVKQYHRRDYEKNPERFNANVHRRRARLAKAEGHFSRADLHAIYAAQSGCCYYCGTSLVKPIHIEHRTPISRGGTNWPDNLALTCEHCNLSKGAKTEAEFRALQAPAPGRE